MAKTVKATREGLVGHRTSSGYVIDNVVSFVALPAWKALRKFVRITNPANNESTIAEVLDVGPWNVDDDDYVFGDATPQAKAELTTQASLLMALTLILAVMYGVFWE